VVSGSPPDSACTIRYRAGWISSSKVSVLVLSATARNPYWAEFLTEEQMTVAHNGIRELHASIAAGSSRGEHRLLHGASHQYLHIEQPDAVVQAVLDVLARVAEPGL
jgi:hypothetical protein